MISKGLDCKDGREAECRQGGCVLRYRPYDYKTHPLFS